MDYTYEQLNSRYEARTGFVRCHCSVATPMVGGVPADEDGIRAFVKHHLLITDIVEIEKAVKRIMTEEIGERDVTPETGELNEKKVYGVNVVRRTKHGPWLGNWMIKACAKQAASRFKIFTECIGSKSDMSEGGRAYAIERSFLDKYHPEQIYLIDPLTGGPAKTYFHEFMGRVQTPSGPKSIVHHSECIEPGSLFSFEFRFIVGYLKEEDIRDTLALMMNCGLGSVRSMECGKFRIEQCSIHMESEKPQTKAARSEERKAAKEEKEKKEKVKTAKA